MENTTIREVQVQYGRTWEFESFRSPAGVVDFLRKVTPNNSQEHVVAVYLDGGHKPIGYSIVSIGTANSCPIHPRDVYQRAVLLGACAVIIAHNHPTGDVTPSAEDRDVTKKMKEAAIVLGIKLLDHVIFSDTASFSFMESNNL